LPVAAPWLVIGQLVAPVFLASGVQLTLLLIVQALLGGIEWLLLIMAVFVIPLNFFLFAVENLLFLLFPVRLAHTSAADLQMLGRRMLIFLAKMLLLGVTGVVISLTAAVVYLLTLGSWFAALAVAWLLLAGVAAAMVSPVALAFQQFDVARDTPP
jgi:hypothetical protein